MTSPRPPLAIALAGKLGPPLFAATFVHCLLTADVAPLHLALITVGLVLMVVEHYYGEGRGR